MQESLDFQDVLMVPLRPSDTYRKNNAPNSRREVSPIKTLEFPHYCPPLTCCPVVAANMYSTGTYAMAEELSKVNMMTCLSKHIKIRHDLDDAIISSTFISFGSSPDEVLKAIQIFKTDYRYDKFCLDVANGYIPQIDNAINTIRDALGDQVLLMVGNVINQDRADELAWLGADIVKVGIGSGSVCTTRLMTGIGLSQFTAVRNCIPRDSFDYQVCSDGGCSTPGDICKALALGAGLVMIGGMLAGHDECSGPRDEDGRQIFYGMSSLAAMNAHGDGLPVYRAAEGKCVSVASRGPVANTLAEIQGGMRSFLTYVGERDFDWTNSLAEECVQFIRVPRQTNPTFNN